MSDKTKEIESLIDRAAKTDNSDHALKFSQAACNAANAMLLVERYRVEQATLKNMN
jgi:uncharacterized protein (DUF1778 family)